MTPKRETVCDDGGDDEYDDLILEEDANNFGRGNVAP